MNKECDHLYKNGKCNLRKTWKDRRKLLFCVYRPETYFRGNHPKCPIGRKSPEEEKTSKTERMFQEADISEQNSMAEKKGKSDKAGGSNI